MSYFLVICGPTASGKSFFALSLAKKYNGAIINADCLQVYADIPIITASPNKIEKKEIPHYLYNFLPINHNYSVAQYVTQASQYIKKLIVLNKLPIIVGGSGLYISSLLYGLSYIPTISKQIIQQAQYELNNLGNEKFYKQLITQDPLVIGKIHPNDTQRMLRAYSVYLQNKISLYEYRKKNKKLLINYNFDVIMLLPEKNLLYQQCNQRLEKLLDTGGLKEILNLYLKRHTLSYSISKALSIPQFFNFFSQKLSYSQALNLSKMKTRNYAKRQITWFYNQINDKTILKYQTLEELQKITNEFDLNKLNRTHLMSSVDT